MGVGKKKKGKTLMKPHEIAQHIVNLKGDLLRIGPSDNAGRESLYIINEGILERLEASLLDNEIQQIAGKTSDYIYNNVFRNIKSKLLAQQQSDGIQRKIKDLHSYTTRNACLFEGDDILNITQDDSGGEKLELTTLEKYLAEGGAPFHERFTFALDTKLFSSAVAFGSDEDELKSAVECFCPEWHRFLKTSLVSYEYDCIPVLEFVGNFLLPINSFYHRGFWFLVGKTYSGKTTLLNLLSELVGGNIQLFNFFRGLNDEFAFDSIYEGDRRAIDFTITEDKIAKGKRAEILVALSEGGRITAKQKYKKPITVNKPLCYVAELHLWSKFPKFCNTLEACKNRAITIVFGRDESAPIDFDLLKKLKKEAPVFCALAMARLAYLIKSKRPFTSTYAKRFPDIQQKFNFTEDPLATSLRSAIRCGGDADYYQKISEKYGNLFTKDPAISWQNFADWIADFCYQNSIDPGEYLKIDKKNENGRIIEIYSLKKETRQKILTELIKRGAIYENKAFHDPEHPEHIVKGLRKCFFID